MSNVMGKVMNFLGLSDDYENDDVDDKQEEENEEEELEVSSIFSQNKHSNKVVDIRAHNVVSAKIVIVKPMEFDEAASISDNLRNRKIVVVNTTAIEAKIARRILDFLSGCAYALNADIQEVEKGVYILSPSSVEVTNELKNELSNKGILNWSK